MTDLNKLASLAEQKKLRDLAALAARQADCAGISIRIAAIQNQLAEEARQITAGDQGGNCAFERYAWNTQQRLKQLLRQLEECRRHETAARSDALRSFGRTRAVALLASREAAQRAAIQARKDEIMGG